MKTATTALKNLLLTRDIVYADLYTFSPVVGSPIRLCGGDRLINAALPGFTFTGDNGYTWALGVPISDGGVKAKIGLSVDTVKITCLTDEAHPFQGSNSLQAFIRARALNGAQIRIDRAFAPSWASMRFNGATGTINRFKGIYGGVESMSNTQVVIMANPLTALLDSEEPHDLYQVNCANIVYDNKCTLSEAAYTASGSIDGTSTLTSLNTTLSNAANRYALGKITFTSGLNDGIMRMVKADDGSGNLTLIQPLPYAPVSGDDFTVSAGCDLTWGTCGSKFDNQDHFRGQTKIPPPESSL